MVVAVHLAGSTGNRLDKADASQPNGPRTSPAPEPDLTRKPMAPQPTQRGAIPSALGSKIICAACMSIHFDKNLTGRTEKRLPIMVIVRLSALTAETGEVEEKT